MKLTHQNIVLEFDDKTGAILSGIFSGQQLLYPAKEFFSLGLRSKDGDPVILYSSDFDASLAPGKFLYRGSGQWAGITVQVIISRDGGFFRFRPDVLGIPAEYSLEWLDLPQLVTGNTGKIFWPCYEGLVIDDFQQKETYTPYRIGTWPNLLAGFFPGGCQMQFLSYFEDKSGLYFAAHDLACTTKNIDFELDKNTGRVRLSLQTFTDGSRNYRSSFEYVIGETTPDWYGGCDLYKDFIAGDPQLPPKGADLGFAEKSPIVMIYPVRGEGDDKGSMAPNEYFPYVNAMSAVRKYAELLDSPILTLVAHWEGTAPWAPPYVWPPYGGKEALAEYRDALHAEGHYLGVYCSGYAWTQRSTIIPDYSREEECREKNLERFMCKGPKGELDAKICTGPDAQRYGYDLCLGEEWGRNTIVDEIQKLADFGIDYAQYFDQNLGGASHLCYSTEHHHSPSPGIDQVNIMKSVLSEITQQLRDSGSQMMIGCEAAAAHPYVKYMPFNDERFNFNYGTGIPVPGYAYIFHEYVHGFMGNQCGISYRVDCEASPDNLLFRISYGFHAGEALSILLKDKELIHWGWIAPHSMKEPEQEPLIQLIRSLNCLRRKYPEAMLHGKMLRPQFTVNAEPYVMQMTEFHGKPITHSAAMVSTWECADGKVLTFVTNFRNINLDITLTDKDGREKPLKMAPLETLVFEE